MIASATATVTISTSKSTTSRTTSKKTKHGLSMAATENVISVPHNNESVEKNNKPGTQRYKVQDNILQSLESEEENTTGKKQAKVAVTRNRRQPLR